MAEVVRYDDTASTAGGDGTVDTTSGANRAYVSVLAAEAAEQANFDTANNWLHVYCRSSVGGPDTTAASISGSTTSATDFIMFEGNGEQYAHELLNADNLAIPDEYVRFKRFSFSSSSDGAVSPRCANLTPSAGGNLIWFDRCDFRETAGGGSGSVRGILSADADTVLKVSNSFFKDFRQGTGRAVHITNATSVLIVNCGFHNCDVGMEQSGGTVTAKNTWAQDCTDGFAGTIGGSNNCSDISSDAPGTSPQTGSIVFVNEAGDNFHLDASDTVAIGNGIGPGSDSDVETTDYDGDTRSGSTCDIGPDEVAASGSTGTLATTNALDTSAASGTTTILGTLARTNPGDTSAASGTTTVTGSLATTNANDTLAAAGTTTIAGALATTNADDTLSAAGTSGSPSGTVNVTNANDTLVASGSPVITGTVAVTNGDDAGVGQGESGIQQGGGGGPKRRRKSWDERERERLAELAANRATIEARERREKYGDLPPALEKELTGSPKALAKTKPLSPRDMQEYERVRIALNDDEEAFALILGAL